LTKIIDCHQHFWKIARGDYNWLDQKLDVLYRNYEPEDLEPTLKKANITKTILVQAAPTIEETQYILSLADRYEFIAGVVGWVDLESPSAPEDIALLAKHPKFKGVRPMIQNIKDVNWAANPTLTPAIQALVTKGLRFDALVLTQHLNSLMSMMDCNPDLPTVINHAAKPSIASNDLSLWKRKIKNIASNSNAYCKLSGLVNEASNVIDINEIKPVFEHLLESFGPDRIMWGSDWPVVRLRTEYADWLSMTLELLSDLPSSMQANILGENARRFYSL